MLRKGIIEGRFKLPATPDLCRALEPNLHDAPISYDTSDQVGRDLDNILLPSVSVQLSRLVTFTKSNLRFFSICRDTLDRRMNVTYID